MLAAIVWTHQTLAVVMIFSIPIVTILALFWSHVEEVRSVNELKRSMVARGMSADEIERVISAGPAKK